jgi:hypothetical protein
MHLAAPKRFLPLLSLLALRLAVLVTRVGRAMAQGSTVVMIHVALAVIGHLKPGHRPRA